MRTPKFASSVLTLSTKIFAGLILTRAMCLVTLNLRSKYMAVPQEKFCRWGEEIVGKSIEFTSQVTGYLLEKLTVTR